MQLLVDNRSDSTKMHGATIRFINGFLFRFGALIIIRLFLNLCNFCGFVSSFVQAQTYWYVIYVAI